MVNLTAMAAKRRAKIWNQRTSGRAAKTEWFAHETYVRKMPVHTKVKMMTMKARIRTPMEPSFFYWLLLKVLPING